MSPASQNIIYVDSMKHSFSKNCFRGPGLRRPGFWGLDVWDPGFLSPGFWGPCFWVPVSGSRSFFDYSLTLHRIAIVVNPFMTEADII